MQALTRVVHPSSLWAPGVLPRRLGCWPASAPGSRISVSVRRYGDLCPRPILGAKIDSSLQGQECVGSLRSGRHPRFFSTVWRRCQYQHCGGASHALATISWLRRYSGPLCEVLVVKRLMASRRRRAAALQNVLLFSLPKASRVPSNPVFLPIQGIRRIYTID